MNAPLTTADIARANGEVDFENEKRNKHEAEAVTYESSAISADGGDDDRRRTFPPPRKAVAAVRNRVFRRPGHRRHARSESAPPKIATPDVVAGRPLPIAKQQAMMLAHTRATLAPPRAANAAPPRPHNRKYSVKIRLNHQNSRNLHAPAIAAPYLCTKKNQKCL